MDTVGEEEHDPIKLKSIKNNRTFTVPQNDRVRHFFPTSIGQLWFLILLILSFQFAL